MKLRLISQDPLASPREIELEQFPADIGRGVDVALRIDDRWISRRHCRLTVENGEVYVRDLGSRHGTYVNGQAIEKACLRPGTELCLGLSHFLVATPTGREEYAAAGHDSAEFEPAAIRSSPSLLVLA